jgi:hypothetical protein
MGPASSCVILILGAGYAEAVFSEGPGKIHVPASSLPDDGSEHMAPDGTRWARVRVDVDPRKGAAASSASTCAQAAPFFEDEEARRVMLRKSITYGLVALAQSMKGGA